MKKNNLPMQNPSGKLSLSGVFTALVTGIVLVTSMTGVLLFAAVYRKAMEENAITSGEQAVVQVQNTVEDYTEDMDAAMDMIQKNMEQESAVGRDFIASLVKVRGDIVAVTSYNDNGQMTECWSDGKSQKKSIIRNLSYPSVKNTGEKLNISKPHVESLLDNYYPWVVTISRYMIDADQEEKQVSMDIRFSNIANYVDDVGIGQHGYCYIVDTAGNIVYHPQQQLLYAGLKTENTKQLREGSYQRDNVIYTVHTLSNCNWRIVGVCYVDEMITEKVKQVVSALLMVLFVVLLSVFLSGWILSRMFARPANNLMHAMRSFEKDAENFHFEQVGGTSEVAALSDSFGHMVLRIQHLMENARKEEISLKKTELKALQAQINPHFLYNTLDAISWMCEDGRTEDAQEMVNALARLFRISISRGHELISIEKEVEHARSYLMIEQFRYRNQFTYTFQIEEACLSYMCNKITLQPIIENCIYHGLNRMVEEGKIHIQIQQDKEDILFSVRDNGVGMSEEQIQQILSCESDKAGIGIKNVNDRVKIFFGNQYGLSITSELDEGTCVVIRMPKVKKGESYEKE